jgi:uncharacterized protein (TIGR00369 family)
VTEYTARDPKFVERVKDSFARQPFMKTFGAEMGDVRPGYAEVILPFSKNLTQQHGFIHAGAVSAIVDNAGGYAAFSLFEPGDGVLTVEFKINMMAPAEGEKLIARANVIRPGKTLTITSGDVIAIKNGKETVCALMQQTIMRIIGRPDVVG